MAGTTPAAVSSNESRLPAAIVVDAAALLQVVPSPLIVQVTAVSTPSSRSVTVTELPTPGAEVATTARSCAIRLAFGESVWASPSTAPAVEIPTADANIVPPL